MVSITNLALTRSRPLNAIDLVVCTDIFKPYSVILEINLLFENGKCGPLPNVNSLRFLLDKGPHQQIFVEIFHPRSIFIHLLE